MALSVILTQLLSSLVKPNSPGAHYDAAGGHQQLPRHLRVQAKPAGDAEENNGGADGQADHVKHPFPASLQVRLSKVSWFFPREFFIER